jgi:hypothetical protein
MVGPSRHKRPGKEENMDTDDGQPRRAGFPLKRQTDRVQACIDGRTTILFRLGR